MSKDVGSAAAVPATMIPGLSEGMAFGDGFTLVRRLGAGGMGEVWLAREKSLRRDVALKIMRPPFADGAVAERALRRFTREEKLLASCSHPAILPIWKSGTDVATGLPWYATKPCLLTAAEARRLQDDLSVRPCQAMATGVNAMPLSLADILKDGSTLPDRAAARIGRQLVAAVAYVHSLPEPFIHRDIKPSNVLFCGDGNVVLSDLGVAKHLHSDGSDGVETTTTDSRKQGLFVGTFSYSAPEQQTGGDVSPAVDYYAIGAILYESITGRKPRSLEMPSAVAPSRISRKWDDLLKRMLEPDPARRLANPSEIDAMLAEIERGDCGGWKWAIAALVATSLALAAILAIIRQTNGPTAKRSNGSTVQRSNGQTVERTITLPGGQSLSFAWVPGAGGFWIAEHELTAAESAAIFGQPADIPEDRKGKPVLADFGATSPAYHLMLANLIDLPEGRRLDIPTESEWEAASAIGLTGPSPEICREPYSPPEGMRNGEPWVVRSAAGRAAADGKSKAAFRLVLR